MALNIASKTVRDTARIDLDEPDGTPLLAEDGTTRCAVTIYGPGSKPYAAAAAARSQRMVAAMSKKGARTRISAEEQTAESATFLADITVSLHGFDYNGATDRAALVAMYSDLGLGFIADQIQAKVGDWANFMKGPSAT